MCHARLIHNTIDKEDSDSKDYVNEDNEIDVYSWDVNKCQFNGQIKRF